MTWMAWRQLRSSAAFVGAILLAALITLTITGVHLHHEYSSYRSCADFGCDGLLQRIRASYEHVKLLGALLIVGPAILGIFWGAPLVSRELESGTFRLAWTQGISRTRWITTRILVGALAVLVAGGLFAFAFSWWAKPFDLTGTDRIGPAVFDQRGVVPVAYALFGFALGIAAGALIRRTLPAMGVTLVGFVGVRMLTQYLVRPHLLTPLTKSVPLSLQNPLSFLRSPGSGFKILPAGNPDIPHAWTLSTTLVNSAGAHPSPAFLNQACSALINQPSRPGPAVRRFGPPPPRVQEAMTTCLHNVAARFHEVVSYQPASRFWAFQWLESAIFVGLAVALLGLAVYWVRRRLV